MALPLALAGQMGGAIFCAVKHFLARAARRYPPHWPGAFALARTAGYIPVTIRGQNFRCDPYHVGQWGWIASGDWEPETFDVFDRYLTRESVYYDVGAWIGPTVLYAARRVREVYAFEPDPTAYSYLLMNLRLNQVANVHPANIALMPEDGSIQMASFGTEAGDSMTSALKSGGVGSTTALGLSWATWQRLTCAPAPTFVKMDIEGAEFSLVPSLYDLFATQRPLLYLSTHAPYLPVAERVRKLTILRDGLTMYRNCLDEHMQPVSHDELLSLATQGNFRSFLFADAE